MILFLFLCLSCSICSILFNLVYSSSIFFNIIVDNIYRIKFNHGKCSFLFLFLFLYKKILPWMSRKNIRRSTPRPIRPIRPVRPIPQIHQIHHRVRNLPEDLNFLEYVPIARSLDCHNGCVDPSFNVPIRLPASTWIEDHETKQCMRCKEPFHMIWNRRRHCRVCGKVICNECGNMMNSGFAHSFPSTGTQDPKLLATTCDVTHLYHGENIRVCHVCRPILQRLSRGYTLAKVLGIVLVQFPDTTEHFTTLGGFFQHLEKCGGIVQSSAKILRNFLVSAQYIETKPWIPRQNIQTHGNLITKCILQAAYFRNPDLDRHFFYKLALDFYKIPKIPTNSTKIPQNSQNIRNCHEISCRKACQEATNNIERMMTVMFSQKNPQNPQTQQEKQKNQEISFEMAILFIPGMIFGSISKNKGGNVYHLDQISRYARKFGDLYRCMLYIWIRGFPLGVMDRSRLLSLCKTSASFGLWEKSWTFFRDLCQTCRICRGDIKHSGFRILETKLSKYQPILPGTPHLKLISIDFQNIKRAKSSSKPYILPCKFMNITTQRFMSRHLLVKHNQSLGADAIVHLLIRYFQTKIKKPHLVQTYPTIPIGSHAGILVMVPNSVTIDVPKSLQKCIYQHPNNKFKRRHELNYTFSYSTAFFSMLACFIGLRDRIAANMMVRAEESIMFHIDFEYLFNQQPRFKETVRGVGDAVSKLFAKATARVSSSSSSSKSSSSSSFSRHETKSGTLVVKPLLPSKVMEMLGGEKSDFYRQIFTPDCNAFFQLMWDHRHLFYFSTRFLTFFPSTTEASQLTPAFHDKFYHDLVETGLDGSDTYGEYACKILVDPSKSKKLTERVLVGVNKFMQKRR